MNCREALLHLYEYLDNELTEDVVKKIEGHLTICEHCFDKYEFEKMLHKVIADRGRAEVNAEPLKAKVLERIAEIDREGQAGGFFSQFRPYLAAAAAMVVIVLTLYSSLDKKGSSAQAALRPFVTSHLENVVDLEGPQPVSSPAEIQEAVGRYVNVPSEFYEPAEDRLPVRGFVENCSGSETAHIIFRYIESDLSLYVISDSTFKPCSDLKVVKDGHHTYHCCSLDGMNLIIWECETSWCLAVAGNDVEDLIEFASAY